VKNESVGGLRNTKYVKIIMEGNEKEKGEVAPLLFPFTSFKSF
jgi:hypothetical protein